MRFHLIAAAAASLLMSDIALAQAPATTPGAAPSTSAPAATPSRSRTRAPAAQAPAATQPAAAAPAAAGSEATTGRRQRSPAQLRNDQIMRDCGAEWRGQRDQLRAQGKTWRSFLQECRQRRRG